MCYHYHYYYFYYFWKSFFLSSCVSVCGPLREQSTFPGDSFPREKDRRLGWRRKSSLPVSSAQSKIYTSSRKDDAGVTRNDNEFEPLAADCSTKRQLVGHVTLCTNNVVSKSFATTRGGKTRKLVSLVADAEPLILICSVY